MSFDPEALKALVERVNQLEVEGKKQEKTIEKQAKELKKAREAAENARTDSTGTFEDATSLRVKRIFDNFSVRGDEPPPSFVAERNEPVNDFSVKLKAHTVASPMAVLYGFKSLRVLPHPIDFRSDVFDTSIFPTTKKEAHSSYPVTTSMANLQSGAWPLQTMSLVERLGYHSFPKKAAEFEPDVPKTFPSASKWHEHVKNILRYYLVSTSPPEAHTFTSSSTLHVLSEVYTNLLLLMSGFHHRDPVVTAGMRYAELSIWVMHNSTHPDKEHRQTLAHRLSMYTRDMFNAIRDHTDFTVAEAASFSLNIVHARLHPECLKDRLPDRSVLPEHILELSPHNLTHYDSKAALDSINAHYANKANQVSIWDNKSYQFLLLPQSQLSSDSRALTYNGNGSFNYQAKVATAPPAISNPPVVVTQDQASRCSTPESLEEDSPAESSIHSTPVVVHPSSPCALLAKTLPSVQSADWVLDSGASHHFCNDLDQFVSYHQYERPESIGGCADGISPETLGSGMVVLKFEYTRLGRTARHKTKKGEKKTVVLHDVQYSPTMTHNLLSPHALAMHEDITLDFRKSTWTAKSSAGDFRLAELSTTTNLAMVTGAVDGARGASPLLALGDQGPLRYAHYTQSALVSIADRTSHIRLAHASMPLVKATLRPDISTGLDKKMLQDQHDCHCCSLSMTKTPKEVTGNSKALRPLDVITVDTIHQTITSSMGFKHAVLIKEEYTKFMAVYLVKDMYEPSQCVISFLKWASTQLSCFRDAGRPRKIHLDQGSEFAELRKYAAAEGMEVETTHTNDHSANGSIESSVGKVRLSTRKLIRDGNLPFQMWDFAILHAVSVHNVTFHQHIESSPYVLFHRKIPNLSRLRAFGSVCYVVHPDTQRDFKLQETALMGIYLGHVQLGKHYLVWDPLRGRVFQSPYVRFLEHRRLRSYMKQHPELSKPRLVQKFSCKNPSSLSTSGQIVPPGTVNDTYTSNEFGFSSTESNPAGVAGAKPFPAYTTPYSEPTTDGGLDIPDFDFESADEACSGGRCAGHSDLDMDDEQTPAMMTNDGAPDADGSFPDDIQTNVSMETDPDSPAHVDPHFSAFGSSSADPSTAGPAVPDPANGPATPAPHTAPETISVVNSFLPNNLFSTELAPPGTGSQPFASDSDGTAPSCYAPIPRSDPESDVEVLTGKNAREPQIVLTSVESPPPLARTAPMLIGEAHPAPKKKPGRPKGSKNKPKVATLAPPPSAKELKSRTDRAQRATQRRQRKAGSQQRSPTPPPDDTQPTSDGHASSAPPEQGDPVATDTGVDSPGVSEQPTHTSSDSGSQGDSSSASTDAARKGETSGDIQAASDEHMASVSYELSPKDRAQLEKAVRARMDDQVAFLNYQRLLREASPYSKAQRTDDLGSKESSTGDYGDSRAMWEQEVRDQEMYKLRSKDENAVLSTRKRMWAALAQKARKQGRGTVLVDYHAEVDEPDYFTSYKTTTVLEDGQEWLPSVPLPTTTGFSALTVSVQGALSAGSTTEQGSSNPERYRQAMNLPDKDHWKLAMNEEMDSIKSNNVFEWVDKAEVAGQKILPSRWVYNKKFNLDGSLERYKARVVAKGFVQEPEVDYLMSFSPVIRFESVRFFLAFATFKKWHIYQMDVKTAFLYGDIDKTTFMRPPEGFAHPKDPSKVWKLKKSLYGLVQAPRCWNQKLHEVLTKYGLQRHQSEHGLYSNEKHKLFVGVYVDDLLITGANTTEVSKLKKYLTDNFKMKDLGPVSKFLGMQVSLDKHSHSYSLDMEGYISQMSKDLDIPVKHKVLVPIDPKDLERLKEESPLTDATVFRQGIGKLSYLAHAVRVDIAHAVNFLATFNQAPCESHQFLLHKLLRYVCDTKDYKITWTKPKGPLTPLVYTDANWGSGYPDHNKTYEGLLVLMCGGPVCWRSSKQKSIALSTAEAEYMALSEGTKTAKWLTEVYEDFGLTLDPKAIGILVDNQAAIQISNDPQFYPRTKHIKRRYHFTREAVNNNEITVSFVETGNQLADFLTKPLVWTTLNPTLQKIGMNAKTGRSSDT